MRLCEYFANEAKMDQKLLQKQVKCNLLIEDIKKKAIKADALTKQIAQTTKEIEKHCSKIKKIKGLNIDKNEIDISSLSKNQKKQVLDMILQYKQ